MIKNPISLLSFITVPLLLSVGQSSAVSFCDAPVSSGLTDQNFLNNLGFQEPASPLMEGLIALHSDIWAIMLFVAGFVLTMILVTLYRFNSQSSQISYKVHHHSLIEIIWTTIPALILCVIAIPSFTLLYSLDEIVEPSLTIKAIGRQWYWSAPFNGDFVWEAAKLITLPTACKSPAKTYEVIRSPDAVLSRSTRPMRTCDVERLKGPEHAIKGGSARIHLVKSLRTKCIMVKSKITSEIHTSLPVGVTEQASCPRGKNSSFHLEVGGGRSPQHAGPLFLPKIQANQNHWNSGLAKARKSYANGDLVVVRNYSSQGGQSKTPSSLEAERNSASNGMNDSSRGLKPYIGKYCGLFQPEVYKIAYEEIKGKPGNTTPGVDKQTLDGIDLIWIDKIIAAMKDRSFQFKPVLRKYISKPNGKLRSLGIPTPKDKVVQQAMRLLIEPMFEPEFLDCSYGFRPGRSTHDALKRIRQWTGATWIIEGDIKGCFDNVNHFKLAQLLEARVKDKNLIDLYWKAVKVDYINAGHTEPHSLSGVTQGGVLSPLLSNIYLHEFDIYVNQTLIPQHSTKTNVKGSRQNPAYTAALKELREARRAGSGAAIRKAERHRMSLASVIRTDTKIRYVRYADDWIIALNSSYKVAQQIKLEVRDFLKNRLDLELSEEKTKITHLPSDKAKFLGVYIKRHSRRYSASRLKKKGQGLCKTSNPRIQLEVPTNLLVAKLADLGYYDMKTKRPRAITKWIYMQPEEIISRYNAIIRGYANYYSFVDNKYMMRYIMWILEYSLVFTFCRKWNISAPKVFKKLGKDLSYQTGGKTYKMERPDLKPTPLKFAMSGKPNLPDPEKLKYFSTRSRFSLDQTCCICDNTPIEMHHVRHLRHSKAKGITKIMASLNRKQIPLCKSCHNNVHRGLYDGNSLGKFKTSS
jgi:group II intron reverse transcriptase/maturase